MSQLALVVGSWSILHSDHVNLLRVAKRIVGKEGQVVVGVNSDDLIEKDKGFRPEIHEAHRLEILESIRYVDEVFLNTSADISGHVHDWTPDYILAGTDWEGRGYLDRIGVTVADLAEIDCSLVYVASNENYHSSDLRSTVVTSYTTGGLIGMCNNGNLREQIGFQK